MQSPSICICLFSTAGFVKGSLERPLGRENGDDQHDTLQHHQRTAVNADGISSLPQQHEQYRDRQQDQAKAQPKLPEIAMCELPGIRIQH